MANAVDLIITDESLKKEKDITLSDSIYCCLVENGDKTFGYVNAEKIKSYTNSGIFDNPTIGILNVTGNALINGNLKTNGKISLETSGLSLLKSDLALNQVTNDAQVKGLSSIPTSGNIVTWGNDGYTVMDSGFTIAKSVPSDAIFKYTAGDNITIDGNKINASGGVIPNDGILTIKQNGVNKGTFTANLSTDNTIDLADTTYGVATTLANGLMSYTDKSKLDGVATGATNVVQSTVSDWGFTKNSGTVTSVAVKINNETKGTITSSGTIDLGSGYAKTDAGGNLSVSGTLYATGFRYSGDSAYGLITYKTGTDSIGWTYREYWGGLIEAWYSDSFNVVGSSWSAIGNIFRAGYIQKSYPVTFASVPNILISVTTNKLNYVFPLAWANGALTTGTPNIYAGCHQNYTLDSIIYVHIYVRGVKKSS